MIKRRFLEVVCWPLLAASAPQAWAQTIDASAVARHYGALASAGYEDALAGALTLRRAVQAFTGQPSAAALVDSRQAWIAAREWYGRTEAFRFYGGPIDGRDGPERRLNAWPVDESYLDAVAGRLGTGLVNDRAQTLTKATLPRLNERGGEENVASGWHAIEFLLWGQDLRADGPGDRPFTDFVDGQAPNADRRQQFLVLATDLLIDDLRWLVRAWAPNERNYRHSFEREGIEAVRKIIVGIGSLSRGELAGERLAVALATQDQEDEQSCFSDNTHHDIVNNVLGIENVWLGRILRRDGTLLQGASLRTLVAQRDAALAERTTWQVAASVAAARAIKPPFDREVVGGPDAPGRARVQKTIDSLMQQAKDLADAAAVLGISRLTLSKPGAR